MKHLWTPWRMTYLRGESPGGAATDCIFCAKPKSTDEAAEHLLARGTHCYVTLNLYPYNNGHLMVIPYRHVANLQALSAEECADLMALTQKALAVLDQAYHPEGYNVGFNLGRAAGAGIAEHLHQHIVPRWPGDTNYMSVVGEMRVIPEWIDQTYTRLREIWQEGH